MPTARGFESARGRSNAPRIGARVIWAGDHHIATMSPAVVPVARIRDARIGRMAPAARPWNVTVCPPAMTTARLPAPPHRPHVAAPEDRPCRWERQDPHRAQVPSGLWAGRNRCPSRASGTEVTLVARPALPAQPQRGSLPRGLRFPMRRVRHPSRSSCSLSYRPGTDTCSARSPERWSTGPVPSRRNRRSATCSSRRR